MRSERPRGPEQKNQPATPERSGVLRRLAELSRRINPAVAFLIAMHSMGIRTEQTSDKVERDGDTMVAHLETGTGGDIETHEIPPHQITLEADVRFDWGGTDFQHTGLEEAERPALEAQLQSVIDHELEAYRAEGVNPSDAITHIHIDVEAFSDATGARANPEANQALSESRAELANHVLRDILHNEGFDDSQIDTSAHGGGTEGDLMEFEGALASQGFRTHAGSPESMRDEAERIVRAINSGNDSEVQRLTHGLPLEAVHQAYADHVASHRHADIGISMDTVGIQVTHDAGNPPPVLEALRPVQSKDSYRIDIKRPVYLGPEVYEQPRFWQTSGQLPNIEPERETPDTAKEEIPTPTSSTEDWPEITITGGEPTTEKPSKPPPNREERRRQSSLIRTGTKVRQPGPSTSTPTEISIQEQKARRERQTGPITLKVLRSVSHRPVKGPGGYRGFPGGAPGTFAG